MSLLDLNASNLATLESTPKTIVITGGSSGIGLSTASLLSELNSQHNLVLIDLQPPPTAFEHDSSRLLVHTCDITSWKDQRAGFEKAHAKFGRIDCVFVNAGISEYKDQFFTDELDSDGKLREPDRRVLDIDMNAVNDTAKLAIYYMRKNEEGGQITMTASLAGYLASAGAPLYSAAKHGVVGLMRALKQECAKVNIAISVVAPAITVTPILSTGNRENATPADVYAKAMAKNGVPINKPESVARAVCWLFNEGIKANGAGIFVQADKFIDVERGLAKSREQWLSKEMLDLFRGGRKAPLFARLDHEFPSKPKI